MTITKPKIRTGARAASPKPEPVEVAAVPEAPAPVNVYAGRLKLPPFRPGVFDGIRNEDYHRDGALGSTSLKTLATKTPSHYQWERSNSKHTPEFDLGTALHSIVLEEDETGIVAVDADSWRTKAAQQQRDDAYSDGLTPLLNKEIAQAKAMRDSVMAHPVARHAFIGHRAEASVFTEEDGLMLKCRPDAWLPGLLVDLKSALSADPRKFGKAAAELGYHQSAAHYQDVVKAATGEDLPFLFVLAEKTAPFLVSVVELDKDALDLGRRLNTRAKQVYRDCMATNTWPGYPEAAPISLPNWVSKQQEEIAA